MDIHANINSKATSYGKLSAGTFGALLTTTVLSGLIVANTPVSADDSTTYSSAVTINVVSSCTMESNEDEAHTKDITPTQYNDEIGTTSVYITCNNPQGYAVYAVGYGNDTWNDNTLTGTSSSISTADRASTTDSHWYMKIIKPATSGITVENSYDSYKAVPGGTGAGSGYTKVVSQNATTGGGTNADFQTTYGVYTTAGQTIGTYTGKVKYTLVNPHSATDANKPTIEDSAYYMQDIATLKETKLANIGDTLTVVDKRDDSEYLVAKLADNKIWMLDNLALDPTSVDLDTLKGNTNADDQTLTYFKNGGGSSPYPTSGVVAKTASDGGWYNSFELPYIVTSGTDNGGWGKDTTTTSYGAGSGKIGVYYNYCAASAGSYCYAANSGSGDVSQDICPAGWRLPTGGSGGEFQALYNKYNNQTATNTNSLQYNLSLPLSGNFYNSQAYGQGSNGLWWSSTFDFGNLMYSLYVDASNVSPSSGRSRDSGFSVRCVAR